MAGSGNGKVSRKKAGSKRAITGIISVTRKGVGYLSHPDFEEDIEIAPRNLNTALNGDTVEVRLHVKVNGRSFSGEVARVCERATVEFVGVLELERGQLFLVPDDKRMYTDILITDSKKHLVAKDTKALVRLTRWSDPKRDPEGTILQIIGRRGAHETEMRAITLSHGFKADFKKAIEREAREIGKKKHVSAAEIARRRDFRTTPTFTIDPHDAKDFDDALSVQHFSSNEIEIGIHIADVSHYVRSGSAIDKEARERGTSVYLVDRTIPMLPEVLSNDVCSLNPEENKLTYSAVLVLNNQGRVQKRWFGKTIIRSDKRFTYEEAQETLNTGRGIFHQELLTLDRIAKQLRAERFARGAIDFDQEEISFVLNEKGRPIAVKKKPSLDTNRLIEEYMLLANQEIAMYFQKLCKKLPEGRTTFVYRVHDVPDPEKIEELGIFLKAIGHELKTRGGIVSAKELNRLFTTIADTPEENLIKTATIRSMAKAVYSTKNIGHFGLSFAYYTHFTSPIRRYPDIMVHRVLKSHLDGEQLGRKELMRYEMLTLQSSRREVEAIEAERDSIKLKQVEFMQSRIGETFEGVITGVTEWGVYVEEKETLAGGLVHVGTMGGDYFILDKKKYALVGERTGKNYRLGDTVKVKLTGVNLEERALDFSFVQ